MIIPVLLAGGVGSRLWPLSRELYPKQCINLFDAEKSLIQQTAERSVSTGMSSNPIVVCNDEHRFLIAQQMTESGIKADIVLEPAGRNTAPAIALAAFQALERDANAILVVLPADHVIRDHDKFAAALDLAVEQAKNGKLVTFGVKPTYAETGYGYIQAEEKGVVSPVKAFKEKPDAETAEQYVAAGSYYWNSGMFVFSAQAYLDELNAFQPEIYTSVKKAFDGHKVDLDFIRIDSEAFEASPSDSIDYAIMEKTTRAVVVPYDGDWNDIGAWAALYDLNEKDESGNVLFGDVLIHEAKGNFIRSENQLIAAVGVEDLAIVSTKDAVAVMPRSRAQDIKHVVNQLKAAGRTEHEVHTKVYRPWGSYETINEGTRYHVKNIMVKPGEKLSVQKHHHRAEHWIVVKGTANVTVGDTVQMVTENQSIYIPLGEVHALENPGKIPLELIEVQTGAYLGEDDIIRLTDRYGRS
ncbi:mannose-1-phosphate guanylyltransferase/mannose-6-phosphate isomerase [Reinekea marinisedimentorum]|uniref:mannose-1-phosphate guanylyltransferase n=1 Tax=Reinekea marinisedimentorum TaxID=230495 RepID=A0A4R3I9C5_9GAMM|nr:mannose-1-phosphate guanylyltransferase/mannose-6-phosphate isomerase [Reinekea marinisedimentorum]TCS41970.1 mannose-1-phosphate guanylyltransferase [Reinekea marinisedimentorum]